jgi:hypothetical protein
MTQTGIASLRRCGLCLVAVVLIVLGSAVPAWGAEYFVSLDGRDDADGRTAATAFRTIQKGIDALQPGDTLTLAPGEYFERVSRDGLGSAQVDTVIRAQVPGMTVLRGDVPAPELRKVDGFRFVYAAALDHAPLAVIEHHMLHTLLPKANPAELEFDPGYFHYDAQAKLLYISNPDLSPPDQRRYTLIMAEGSGLQLNNPQRVIIDGLAAGGFSGCAINLNVPVACTLRRCVTFLSQIGIRMGPADKLGGEGGGKNVVEHCDSFGHTFGGIVRYGANDDIIRHCRTYKTRREGAEHFGIMHYVAMPGTLLIADNISWGQSFDYSVKPVANERLERNVALGYIRNAKMYNCLIGGGNEYDRGSTTITAPDNILFEREKNLDRNFEFADPLNLDFRLQPDSRFRNAAPDKSDRGPFPYMANIFYLATSGDDAADGLSMRKPWRTLDRALKTLRPGDTLYLDEGEYAGVNWNKPGDGKSPIRLGARGRGTVVIKGKLTVAGAAALKLDRLAFADGLTLNSGSDIAVNNCTFFGPTGLNAEKVRTLSVTHSLFAAVPLTMARCEAVTLAGNIFANAGAPAVQVDSASVIRHSDYNSYQDASQCWQVKSSRRSLREIQRQQDRYSVVLTPELSVEKGVPQLVNVGRFQSLGPHSTAMGLHHDYDVAPASLDLVGPFLHLATDTTANLEWWSSRPATFSIAWGDTPEMTKVIQGIKSGARFNTFTLSGLTPGQTYYFSIRAAEAAPVDGRSLPVLQPKAPPLRFTTASAPRPATVYYVAGDGDDSRDGLSRRNAFRTLKQAADRVGPGDTVMIASGQFNESVRVRAAGAKDQPITFRAMPGERPVIKGNNLARAFELYMKPDIHFDGLVFQGFGTEIFSIRRSPRVQITRCFDIVAAVDESPDLVVRNCVLRGGWVNVSVSRSPRSAIENNVFVMAILQHVSTEDPTVAVRGNIFCENVRNKCHQTLLFLNEKGIESDNCFYVRWPEDERLVVSNRTLPQYRLRSGTNSVAANPMMLGVPGWKQGWQQGRGAEEAAEIADFQAYFTGNPRLILRGTGLQPDAFDGLTSSAKSWPLTQAWAQTLIAAEDAAAVLVKEGKDADAVAAYEALAATTPLPDRLKAQYLEQASQCAQRVKDYDRAMALAKAIPLRPISVRRQMELMLDRKDYAGVLNSFTQSKMGGQNFHQSWTYPELEDVMADLYHYRSIAFRETGDLAAAEADLKIMNDKRTQLGYRCGEAIHDLVSLRLGDFYRQYLNDDERALAAYQGVLDRTTWSPFGRPRKPAARGADPTLAAATRATSEILSKQGKAGEVVQLQFNLLIARADAEASMYRREPALALFRQALAVPGKFTPAMADAAGRIAAMKEDDRNKLVAALGSLIADLSDDGKGLLIRLAGEPVSADQDAALRTILLLAPVEKVTEFLNKADAPKP